MAYILQLSKNDKNKVLADIKAVLLMLVILVSQIL